MPDSALLADAGRKIIYANAAFTRLTGYPEAEVLGRSCRFLHGPETDALVVGEMRKALDGCVSFKGALLNYRKDGASFWNELSITPIKTEAGDVTHYVGIQHDISERRRMESQLVESEQRFRRMANDAPVMIWMADKEGGRAFFNDTWQLYTGRGAAQEKGDGWVAGVHPEDRERVLKDYRSLLKARERVSIEYRMRKADGGYGWVFARWRPMQDPDGSLRGFVGCCMDITETRLAREERGLIERRLQEARRMESLGVMAGGIAHDFNNLLTGILGNQSLAMLEVPPGSPVCEYLEEIHSSATRAADLCKQMLAYSGHGRFNVQQVDLGRLLEDLGVLVRRAAGEAINLRYEIPPRLPVVTVDAGQLRQLVMNLVVNAVEAIGGGAGTLILRAGLSGSRPEGRGLCVLKARHPGLAHVFIEVVDDGPGIRPDHLDRIFEPFFTTKFMGRGLGLPAVLGIVRGHGGELCVHSVVGQGTAFRASFPCALDAEGKPVHLDWKGGGRILVIDDEETVRASLGRMLGSFGFEAVFAGDGVEALQRFGQDPGSFALVVLDLTMPHADGALVFQDLRRIMPSVRVLLISGFSEQDATRRFQGKGLSGFLQKPFGVDQLRSAVRRILEQDTQRAGGSAPPFAGA